MCNKISIAVAGCGNWGKNHVQSILKISGADLTFVCDPLEKNLEKNIPAAFSGKKTKNFHDVLESDVSAIVIATPVPTHYALAKQSLQRGKHVLVEKPICMKAFQAEELCQIAKESGLVLMVGHLLYYHSALVELKNRVMQGEFGSLYFVRSERLNAGIVRKDENAWESLASHDLSLILWFLGSKLRKLTANGGAYLQPNISDVVMANLEFEDGSLGQILVSWLDPVKTRRFTVVGNKKMAVFNDAPDGGLEIFDLKATKEGTQFKFIRTGEVEKIKISTRPALQTELEHFLDCIRSKKTPLTDGRNGLEVLRWLEEGCRQLQV